MKLNALSVALCGILLSSASVGTLAQPSANNQINDRENRLATTRIINGEPAVQGQYPWMTALINASTAEGESKPDCGASFIGGRYILTASHCVENMTPERLNVVVGEYDTDDPATVSRYQVAQIYLHEE